ncbi:hypothetical protein Y032_0096g2874 [Ancylostoma ceylanicum]|uniref:Uncharacterized protein n=1 Tax=Ancylostoma ceylanicum TaxID=53326 RepID=A0A016TK05_9BILA|nr:hypothetical protein Y032_0096g2874 [Ancylostoma ceylanicum]
MCISCRFLLVVLARPYTGTVNHKCYSRGRNIHAARARQHPTSTVLARAALMLRTREWQSCLTFLVQSAPNGQVDKGGCRGAAILGRTYQRASSKHSRSRSAIGSHSAMSRRGMVRIYLDV